MFDSENIGTHLSSADTSIHAGTSVLPKPLENLSSDEISKLLASSDGVSRLIEYLNPKIREHQSALERQVKSVEVIAKEAKQQSDSSMLLVKQAKGIANGAESQAKSAEKEVAILRKQLRLAEKDVADAKKNALFADIISILSIAISIVMPLIESLL